MKQKMLLLAYANLFLVFLGVGLVIPVLPLLKAEMQLSGTTMGLMVAIFAFAQLVVSPFAGRASDRWGRKRMIVLGLCLFSISEFLFGWAQSVSWFYVSRLIGGASAACIMPSVTAYVADLTTLRERSKAMGYVSAAISGGFIIGPGIGGLLAVFGTRVPFFAAGVVAFLGFVVTLVFLKEVPKDEQVERTMEEQAKGEQGILNVLFHPLFFGFFVVILISSFGLQAFESIYSIMASWNFGFTTTDISLIIMFSGSFALVAQLFFFHRIVEAIGEIRLIQWTFFISAIFIIVISLTKQHWLVILSTFVVFLAFDLFRPAVTSYLSHNAGDNQGVVNGLNSTFTSVGNILGPIVAGALFDVNPVSPYYIAGVILFVTGLVSLRLKRKPANN